MNRWEVPWAKLPKAERPHVYGVYPDRVYDPVQETFEPIKVQIHCEICGAFTQALCVQGMPRRWIEAFARTHTHYDTISERRIK